MISITTTNQIPKPIIHKLKFIGQAILDQEKISEAELSILLTDDVRITELNQQYFQRNRATDVIAFPQEDKKILGDIVISGETAERQAIERNHRLEDELVYLLIHGILHLLGFDDTKSEPRRKMRAKERSYLTEFHIVAHPETIEKNSKSL
jgi:probable rRNA maturation factor